MLARAGIFLDAERNERGSRKAATQQGPAMNAIEIARIRNHPSFQQLERQRRLLSWTLAVAMMLIYGGFLLLVAFDKPLAAQPIGAGPMTLAFPLGLGVILAAIGLTGLYVARANTLYDRLTADVVAATPAAAAPPSGAALGAAP
jgi:uncharacterized membrane protein (DUF485 family)